MHEYQDKGNTEMPFRFISSAWNKSRRRRRRFQDHIDPWLYKPIEYWQRSSVIVHTRPTSSVFTLKEMEEATCSFGEGNLVGKGGFGPVYRGTLRSGEVVAIKRMELPAFKEAEGDREFRVEVDIVSRLDHPNLVPLIGYCADGKHRFLVYEYMQNGNLQNQLKGMGGMKMDWGMRVKVALESAKGLAYLHSTSHPIIHRDFNSSNILLDSSFVAKISDFGLAKLIPEGQESHFTSRMLGTFGYFDPEYTSTGKLSLQSDVYAFGVVMLELLTGRGAVELSRKGPVDGQSLVFQVGKIGNNRKKVMKVVDPEMRKGSYTVESVLMFANLASRCVRRESGDRPSMPECVSLLQRIYFTVNPDYWAGTPFHQGCTSKN